MEKRILRLEDDFWRIRTDTGELADAERNALRAYLDEKGFKTAIIDDNLAIAGELTWQEVVEPIEAFYEGEAIRAFQAAQGLPVTGVIDRKVLTALGISYKSA
jgi:murein L,D-transpeptidase YcbB/YkuD